LRCDPIEDDPNMQPLLRAAEKEANKEMGSRPFGSARAVFKVKQRILKEKHGIDWRTPAALNPDVAFD
jgi:hypothetical protein